MVKAETIFIGSSTEGRDCASNVAEALRRLVPSASQKQGRKIDVCAWWHGDVFKPGETFIESLERVRERATAAVLVFSPDDDALIRSENAKVPRDNVVFEYGMFVGALGRPSVVVVQVDDARLPTDINGVSVIRLSSEHSADVRIDMATQQLGGWLRQLSSEDLFPRVTEQLKLLAPIIRAFDRDKRERFDWHSARAVQTQLLSTLTDSHGVNRGFVRLAENELADSVSISAADATGPAGWAGPAPYQYLASQVREYLFANRARGRWQPYVHNWLQEAMGRAITNAQQQMPQGESATRFDNRGEVRFLVGVPRLQYSRILLWTAEELADPMAEQVIKLHEAFRIPLFYIPVKEDAPEKERAFVAFEKRSGGVSVLVGWRKYDYDTTRDTSFRETGVIAGVGPALMEYQRLLAHERLMFAFDAWELEQARRGE